MVEAFTATVTGFTNLAQHIRGRHVRVAGQIVKATRPLRDRGVTDMRASRNTYAPERELLVSARRFSYWPRCRHRPPSRSVDTARSTPPSTCSRERTPATARSSPSRSTATAGEPLPTCWDEPNGGAVRVVAVALVRHLAVATPVGRWSAELGATSARPIRPAIAGGRTASRSSGSRARSCPRGTRRRQRHGRSVRRHSRTCLR